MALTRDYFERDLSPEEAEQLDAELQSSPEAAEALLTEAEARYRATGLPEPRWSGRPSRARLPRAWWWGLVLLAAGAAAAFSLSGTRAKVLEVGTDDGAYPVATAEPAAPPTPAVRAAPALHAAGGARAAAAQPAPRRQGLRLGIPLSLPRAEAVTVTVQDAQGRVRRQVFQGTLPAGEQRLSWDGRDGEGRRVPPGDYTVVVDKASGALRSRVRLRARGEGGR